MGGLTVFEALSRQIEATATTNMPNVPVWVVLRAFCFLRYFSQIVTPSRRVFFKHLYHKSMKGIGSFFPVDQGARPG